jgi:thiamine pyrophosphate-dependent acetolactate synthase large subunit-like protein
MNYIIGHASPPRFGPAAKIARIDIDPSEISTAARFVDIPIVGDCKAVLGQVLQAIKGRIEPDKYAGWRKTLKDGEAAKRAGAGANKYAEDGDIHPVRMLEAVRDFMKRDAILCVDGQETLNFGRQTMSTFAPGHRLNSGPFGTMGVGLPFGIGAKVACPDKQVIVVHGDGSMGMNAMEIDTAVRHKIPILIVISLNGGWTGDPKREKPGRDLGYVRFDKMCEALGGYGEYITQPEEIRPALERAQAKVDEGMVALVNVRTDYRARFAGAAFSDYST